MVRTFQHRISPMTYCLLVVLVAVAIGVYWTPMPRPVMGVCLLVVISLIVGIMERALHTEYVVRDGVLLINRGRFARGAEVPLEKIIKATQIGSAVLVVTAHEEYKIRPQNQENFIRCIEKYRLQ